MRSYQLSWLKSEQLVWNLHLSRQVRRVPNFPLLEIEAVVPTPVREEAAPWGSPPVLPTPTCPEVSFTGSSVVVHEVGSRSVFPPPSVAVSSSSSKIALNTSESQEINARLQHP